MELDRCETSKSYDPVLKKARIGGVQSKGRRSSPKPFVRGRVPIGRSADTPRAWALNDRLKRFVVGTPALASVASRISSRYTADHTIADAFAAARAVVERGHEVSIAYAGEGIRDAAVADAETEVFLQLIDAIHDSGLPLPR